MVSDDVGEAVAEAGKAAAEAGVEVVLATTPAESRLVSEVLAAVWPRESGDPLVLPEFAHALAHADNYVAFAQRGPKVVGACIGFRGADAEGNLLHSHVAAVLPELQGGHVGLAMKLHQRAWSLARGIERMTWTFDPLIARNSYFNVGKLGARVTSFHQDFYGPMADAINQGGPTDRCLATWMLVDRRRSAVVPDEPIVLQSGDGGHPVLSPRVSPRFVCCLPSGIVDMRQREPALADEWRFALRTILIEAYASGSQITAVSRDGRYLIEQP